MIKNLEPIFVDHIPDELEEGKIYISMEYGSAAHLCACGCRRRTITPFVTEHTDDNRTWQLIKHNDQVITLKGSIGNNRFPCKSHYTITNNKVDFC